MSADARPAVSTATAQPAESRAPNRADDNLSRSSGKPTIAVDLRALVPAATGIGVYTRSALLELAALNEFRYLGMAHRPIRDPGALEAAGIELESGPGSTLGVIWQQWTLPRRLREGDVDLIWSPLQTLPVRGTVPGVVTVHDLTVLRMPEAHRWKVRWSQKPFLRRSLDRARVVIAISESTARDLREEFPECADRIRVIYQGVDPAFRPADRQQIDATREGLGCPQGYLLYAGTLEPRKNVGAVLDAWHSLAASDPGAPPLVLVGGYGWRSRSLERRIETLAARHPQRLIRLGRVERSRLIEVIQAASVLLYPSYYEGFGLPVAEAMACAVPVITSDRSSLPEVVGDAGVMVAADDPAALASAARQLLRDSQLAEDLAKRGLERSRRFGWQRAGLELEQAFRDALTNA